MNIFWFRRDLRLNDNTGLYNALRDKLPVLPVFIFDENILDDLNDEYDARINFIYSELNSLNVELSKHGTGIRILYGKPLDVFKTLLRSYAVSKVYCNEDYEPYAIQRDKSIRQFLQSLGVEFLHFKDQVIFHKEEILNNNTEPFKIFTAYKRKWIEKFNAIELNICPSELYINNFFKHKEIKIPGFIKEKANSRFFMKIINSN